MRVRGDFVYCGKNEWRHTRVIALGLRFDFVDCMRNELRQKRVNALGGLSVNVF